MYNRAEGELACELKASRRLKAGARSPQAIETHRNLCSNSTHLPISCHLLSDISPNLRDIYANLCSKSPSNPPSLICVTFALICVKNPHPAHHPLICVSFACTRAEGSLARELKASRRLKAGARSPQAIETNLSPQPSRRRARV